MSSRREIGRYTLHGEIASGGMATVHLGRMRGHAGFARTVAIKRLHESLAHDPDFVVMMLDEARLAARVRHPNVIPTLDVVSDGAELLIVMEYVHGASVARLVRAARTRREHVPLPVVVSIMTGVLHGLHAAHLAKSDHGQPLQIIHRDVSPQNVLVGVDGVARVIDFGVAKAAGQLHTTRDGEVRGKLAYMPREQVLREELDARVDIYGAAVMFWELLAGQRLFSGDNDGAVLHAVLHDVVEPPSQWRKDIPPALDDIVLKGLARNRDDRYATALDFALAIEHVVPPALAYEVGRWVEHIAAQELESRARELAEVEADRSADADSQLLQAPTRPPMGAEGRTRSAQPVLVAEARARTRTRMPILLLGMVVALLVAASAVAVGTMRHRMKPLPAPAFASPPPPSSSLAPPTTTASSAPAPVATSNASGLASSAPAPSNATRPSPAPARPPRGTPPRPRPTADPCDPPYVIDATGVKIAKPSCR